MTVVASGLRDGEMVVVDGQSRLNPGAKVMVLPAQGDTARTTTVPTQTTGGAQQ